LSSFYKLFRSISLSLALCLLNRWDIRQVTIILAIFVQRQIFRMRNNSVRREANIVVGAGLSKRKKEELNRGIEIVRQFQLLRAPKFTEIGTIAEHASAPYINRMIAMDELREIERQLEFINGDLGRIAGESMYAYLSRIRQIALPSLSEHLCERIGLLAEHCRYRHQPFGESELTETRALIKEIVKILNNEQERLSALHVKESTSSALQEITKRLTAGESKKRTYKRNTDVNTIRSALLSSDKNETRLARADDQRKPLIADDKKTISDTPALHFLGSRVTAADTQNTQPSECIPLIA
uniref:Dynamin_M domain-containing protein n=1 Tax=Elaeophora elaphi TaxID=1147741 RepID=A0A0R3RK65_9BILA